MIASVRPQIAAPLAPCVPALRPVDHVTRKILSLSWLLCATEISAGIACRTNCGTLGIQAHARGARAEGNRATTGIRAGDLRLRFGAKNSNVYHGKIRSIDHRLGVIIWNQAHCRARRYPEMTHAR